jgi:hypothetical protein
VAPVVIPAHEPESRNVGVGLKSVRDSISLTPSSFLNDSLTLFKLLAE